MSRTFQYVILGASALAAATVAVFGYKKTKETFFSKKVIVLGRRETGKTTFLTYLMTGDIESNPDVTTGIHKIEKTTTKHLDDLGWDITFADIQKDLPGDPGNYDSWLKEANEADILIYLFRLDHWFEYSHDLEETVEEDIKKLSQKLDHNKKDLPIFIIGTHADLIKDSHSSDKRVPEEELFFKGIRSRLQKASFKDICFLSVNLQNKKDLECLLKQMKERME